MTDLFQKPDLIPCFDPETESALWLVRIDQVAYDVSPMKSEHEVVFRALVAAGELLPEPVRHEYPAGRELIRMNNDKPPEQISLSALLSSTPDPLEIDDDDRTWLDAVPIPPNLVSRIEKLVGDVSVDLNEPLSESDLIDDLNPHTVHADALAEPLPTELTMPVRFHRIFDAVTDDLEYANELQRESDELIATRDRDQKMTKLETLHDRIQSLSREDLEALCERLVNFVDYVSRDRIELSADKIRWQRDDYIRQAKALRDSMYADPAPTEKPPVNDDF